MDIWEINKLTLFLIFFIPGFISIKVYDLFIPTQKRDFSNLLPETIGYSSLNFAFFSWLIIFIHTENFYFEHKLLYFLILIFIMFFMPLIWPLLFLKFASWKPIAKHITNPLPKPWDYVFKKGEPLWVIVHLKDGRKIGGRYDTNSFASSYPEEEEIYLEEVWELAEDGKFNKPIERSKGIIILGKEISLIEMFR